MAKRSSINKTRLRAIARRSPLARVRRPPPDPLEMLGDAAASATGMYGGGGFGGNPYGGFRGNLLSTYGLGNQFGSVTGAFGAFAAMRVASSAFDAANIGAHPERVTRQFQTFDQAFDIRNDATIGAQSSAIANIQAGSAFIKGLESIPVAGALVKLADTAFGLSRSLEDQEAASRRAIEGHIKVLAATDAYRVEQAQFSGNIAAAATEASRQRLAPFERFAADHPQDIDAYAYVLRARTFEAQKVQREIGIGTSRLNTMAESANAAFLYGAAAMEGAQHGSPEAMRLRQAAQRRQLQAEYDLKFEESPEEQRDLVNRAYGAKGQGMLMSQQAERIEAERQTQMGIRQVRAEGEAAVLRTSQNFHEADMKQFDAMAANRIAASRSFAEMQAVTLSMGAQRWAMVEGHKLEMGVAHAGYDARISAAGLREMRLDFDADRLLRMQTGLAHVRTLPQELQHVATSAILAEDQQLVAARRRDLRNQQDVYGARSAAANAQAEDRPREAEVLMRSRALQLEVRNADPLMQAAARGTALAELRALQHTLVDYKGGSTALDTSAYDFTGFDLRGESKDRMAAARAIDNAQKDVGSIRVKTREELQAEVANQHLAVMKTLLQHVAGIVQPWALAH